MRTPDRMTLATAVGVLLTAGCLLPLTEDRSYLVLTASLVGGSAVIGIIGRRLRINGALVRALMVVPGLLLTFGIGWRNLRGLLSDTSDFVLASVAPMAPHEGFGVVSSFVVWLLYLVAESVAVGLERPGWTFPVLVIPYLVPAMVLPEETSPLLFALVAVGYILILATGTFGTHLDRAEKPAPAVGLRRGVALAAGGAALVAWLGTGLVSTTIPERGTAWIDTGPGAGSIQLGDPSQDLIRNIRANSDRVVIRYSTADGRGRYLRLTALSSFDSTGFHLVATDLMPGAPTPEDARVRQAPPVSIRVQVDDFGSEYLPIPWVPRSWDAAGDWRYDPRTLSVVSVTGDRKRATRFLQYSATAFDFQPDQDEIAAATAGDPGDDGLTLGLPAELSQEVRNLATAVTDRAGTDGERVLALLEWLRSDAFTYTTASVAGSTLDTVSDFLLSSRSGYCEQFSGSMAILARVLGIPSRVVIGFLPGETTDTGFEVAVRQMHAWTEVYLDGLGWVAFDPTPTGAANASPAPTPSASSSQPEPSVPTSTRQPNEPTVAPQPTAPAPDDSWPARIGWVSGGLVFAAAVGFSPLTVRSWRRWRRLRPDRDPATMAEDAWDELRDAVLDSGLVWPTGTPRQVAAELSGMLGGQAAESTRALALAVEQARFAPDRPTDTDTATRARQLTDVLRENRTTRAHPLRRLFPRSVLRLRPGSRS